MMPARDSVFTDPKVILDFADHAYNPANDVMFPTIIRAADHLAQPLDAYYMYYAPHNAPGGICLATAPALDGPWKEYAYNPVIAQAWQPNYAVGHVCAPHVIWNKGEGRLFVYYHGDNDITRYALSGDGLAFEYGGTAVDQTYYADYDQDHYDRVFYGRVFAYQVPGKDNRYVFFFVRSSAQGPDKQGIYVSRSEDGRAWDRPNRLLYREAVEGSNFLCSPFFFSMDGHHYIAFHAELEGHTDLYCSEVNAELTAVLRTGQFLDHRVFGAHNPRVADPVLILEQDTVNLVVSIEKRLNQRIGLVKAGHAAFRGLLEAL